MSQQPLSSAERSYLVRRLVADGLADEEYACTVLLDEHRDIPIIIHDREILALYALYDKRAAEFLLERGRPIAVYIDRPADPEPWWMRLFGGRRG